MDCLWAQLKADGLGRFVEEEECPGLCCQAPYQPSDVLVGGDSDCWRSAFALADDVPIDYKMPANIMVEQIEMGILDRLGEGAHKLPTFETDLCDLCFADEPMEGSTRCEDCQDGAAPIRTPWQDAQEDYTIYFQIIGGGIHFLKYKWSSAGYKAGYGADPERAWTDEFPSDTLIFSLREFKALIFLSGDVLVGSAVEMVDDAKRILTAEIAKNAAAVSFNADLENMPTTDVRLSKQEGHLLERYLGYKVRSTMKSNSSNGHKMLQVAREMARADLSRAYPHNIDRSTALHVGATMHEVKRWFSHVGHDFYFHLSEDKDVLRVAQAIVSMLGKKLANMVLPALTSVRGNATRISNMTLEECLELLSDRGRRRFFFSIDQIDRKYDTLFFEDCLYDMTPDDFLSFWRKTGAKTGHAIMFVPEPLITDAAPRSEIYDYEELLPAQDIIEEAFEKFWPGCLLFTAYLPLEGMRDLLLSLLRKLLKKGANVIKDVLLAPAGSNDLLFSVFGPITEVIKMNEIFTAILEKWGRVIWDALVDYRVVWLEGSGNGYRHRKSSVAYWAKERRHRAHGICVDVEDRATHGEMHVYDFHLSTGVSDISYSLSIPKHRASLHVIDAFASYTPNVGFVSKPTYIPVFAEDFMKLVNWALAEPLASLDFAVMMTTLNRIRGGLSLGQNVMVAPMAMFSEDVKSIAMAALIYVYQQSSLASDIESDPDIQKAYESNVVKLAKSAMKYGLVVATGGLAIPVFFVIKWLLTANPTLQVIKDVKPVIKRTIRGKKNPMVKPKDLLDGVSLCLPHRTPEQRMECLLCDLQSRGAFSETGVPADGQEFHLENHAEKGETEILFQPGDMVNIAARIRTAKEQHRALNAMTLVGHIDKMLNWFEANRGAPQCTKVNVNLIKGGPGTGKSTVIRVLLKKFEEIGMSTLVGSPFSKLLDDYKQAKVLGYKGLHDFEAETFWYLSKHGNVDVLLLDEVTNMDWELVQAMALYLGVKTIYLVGDEKQTHLNASAGEGLDPLAEQGDKRLDVSKVPVHILVWNWRNPPLTVKYLNYRFGYKMKSKRSDWDKKPIFLTKAQYDALPPDQKVDREMVYAHATAINAFGKESIQGDKERCMSVRSSQGATYNNAAVSWFLTDIPVSAVLGMKVVAFSRHRSNLYIVCAESIEDDFVKELRDELCDSEEDTQMLKNLPWPEIKTESSNRILTPEEERLNRLIKDFSERKGIGKRITVEMDKYDELDAGTEEISQAEIVHPVPVLVINQPEIPPMPLMEFFRKVFATCFLDLVQARFGCELEIYAFLSKVYDDDKLMGRPCKSKSWFPNLLDKSLPKDKDGKVIPSLELLTAWLDPTWRISVWESKVCLWASEAWRNATTNGPELNVELVDAHAVLMDTPAVHIRAANLSVHASWFDFNLGGKRILTVVKGPYTLGPNTKKTKYIGYHFIKPSGLSREAQELATRHEPIIGSRGLAREKPWSYEKQPHKVTKLRAGKNAYLMMELFDPSGADPYHEITNWKVAAAGNLENKYCDVRPEGFNFDRTKAGKIKLRKSKLVASFKPGMVYHQSDESEETLVALTRIGKPGRKPVLNMETKAWARKLAENYFRENFSDITFSQEEKNAIVESALDAVRIRNYDGRRISDKKKDPMEKLRILVSNKSQTKFKWPMSETKYGQALSMTPPRVNQEFVAFWRVLNSRMKFQAKPHMFLDDYEHQDDFVMRISKAIAELPEAVRFAIVDADNFDSQQSEVTVYIEKCFFELLGGSPRSLEEYYQIRQTGIPWALLGRVYGKMNGEKGSGFPDTKSGNTALQGALADHQFKGIGRLEVKASKGDDWMLVKPGIREDLQGKAEVRAYTNMRLTSKIGDGGSFIGYSVFKEGFVPDIVKAAYKAIAAPARDLAHFQEQQKAYREKVITTLRLGGMEAAAKGAVASGYSANLGECAFEILNSLGHLSSSQWKTRVRWWLRPRTYLRGSFEPQLL